MSANAPSRSNKAAFGNRSRLGAGRSRLSASLSGIMTPASGRDPANPGRFDEFTAGCT